MCVAVLVESNPPTLEELRQMESENPHGAGLAWAQGNSIRYRKGLTAGQVFALAQTLPRPFLLHFRWATHGPKVARLTHPFPLGYRAITSTALRGKAPAVLIHNGVWREYEKYAPGWIKAFPEPSDTAVAALLAEYDEDWLDVVPWSTAVGRAAGGGRMDVTLRGSWTEHKGNLYSNLNWIPRTRTHYRAITTHEIGDDSFQSGWSFEDWCDWRYGAEGTAYRVPSFDDEPTKVLPIGIEDLPEETPIEIRDQLLCEELIKEESFARESSWFAEHAEVQRALATKPVTRPSVGWRRDGKMIHLTGPETKLDEGCE
jgi:hypothetical protein